MSDYVKVELDALASAIETLVHCVELPSVAVKLGTAQSMSIAMELNACLPAGRRLDLDGREHDPWRWLAGSHLERFRERLLLEIGVRYMEWVSDADVLSPDRSIEQRIAEGLALAEAESARAADDTPPKWVESWLRLPPPSATYDLDSWLGEPALGPSYDLLAEDLNLAVYEALRECTAVDEWVYAVDEPEGADRCFRFWPHRAGDRMIREVSPIPNGDDQVFISKDFRWGLYSTWRFDESVDWALSIFGKQFIDAFEALQPQAVSRRIRVDGGSA